MSKDTVTKAVIYCRFSPRPKKKNKTPNGADGTAVADDRKDDQIEDDPGEEDEDEDTEERPCQSNEVQRDYCRAYCGEKRYYVTHEFLDPSRSGHDEERQLLWDAVSAVRKGGVLVVYRLDRLARNVYLAEYISRQLRIRKARIEAVAGGGNGDKPEEVMIRQVLQAFSEYESKVIAARTSALMCQMQRRGERMSKICPYGWRPSPADPTKMLHDREEQSVLMRIRELRQMGLGIHRISAALTQEGKTFRGRVGWHHKSLVRIMQREGIQ